MLLIGETGSGKTSFLNFLWNSELALDLGFDAALEQFQNFNDIKCENPKAGVTESKTSKATVYPNVQLADDFMISIIDTPGFGDSRGMKEDEKHCKTIIDTLKSSVDFVNCICLIINGTVSRMSPSLKYVLSEIASILPRTMMNNLIVIFTNVSDELDLNFDARELKTFLGKEIKQERQFIINNPFCRVEKAKEKEGNLSHTKIAKSLKKAFEEGREMLQDMCTAIKDFEKVHTIEFVTLYNTKQKIEREVVKLLMEYDRQRKIERKIRKAKRDAEAALAKKMLHADYKYTEKVKRHVQIITTKHNTLCAASQCYSNCHLECTLQNSIDKKMIERCLCIDYSTGICRICKHHYTLHYHDEVKHDDIEEEVSFIKPEGKRKFDQAKTMEDRAEILKEELKCEKERVEVEKKSISRELISTIASFEKLGLTRNYVTVLKNQHAIIEYRLKTQDREDCEDLRQALEEIKQKIELVKQTLHGK